MLKEVESTALFVASVPLGSQSLGAVTIKGINLLDWVFLSKLPSPVFILTLFNRLFINNLCPYLLKISSHGDTSPDVAIYDNGSIRIDPFWSDCLFCYSYRELL